LTRTNHAVDASDRSATTTAAATARNGRPHGRSQSPRPLPRQCIPRQEFTWRSGLGYRQSAAAAVRGVTVADRADHW